MVNKMFRDYTLEDAMQAHQDGFDVICKDGRVSLITNEDRLDEVHP